MKQRLFHIWFIIFRRTICFALYILSLLYSPLIASFFIIVVTSYSLWIYNKAKYCMCRQARQRERHNRTTKIKNYIVSARLSSLYYIKHCLFFYLLSLLLMSTLLVHTNTSYLISYFIYGHTLYYIKMQIWYKYIYI